MCSGKITNTSRNTRNEKYEISPFHPTRLHHIPKSGRSNNQISRHKKSKKMIKSTTRYISLLHVSCGLPHDLDRSPGQGSIIKVHKLGLLGLYQQADGDWDLPTRLYSLFLCVGEKGDLVLVFVWREAMAWWICMWWVGEWVGGEHGLRWGSLFLGVSRKKSGNA